MRKLRSDSKWAALTPDQREKLEGWLFDEGVSYAVALGRAKKQFGITASIPSLAEFYRRMDEERQSKVLNSAQDWLKRHPVNEEGPEAVEQAAFKMLTIGAYEMAVAGPKAQLKELRETLKLLLQKRLQEVREKRVDLKEKELCHRHSQKILKTHQELHRYIKWLRANGGTTDEESRHIIWMLRKAGGEDVPDQDVGLESDEKEKQEEEAERDAQLKQLFRNPQEPCPTPSAAPEKSAPPEDENSQGNA